MPGAKECSVCPPGQYTVGPGRSKCSVCPAGFACPELKPPPKYLFVMPGCRCTDSSPLLRLATGYSTPEKCYEKCSETKDCISFYLWGQLTIKGTKYNGVCDLASCSFGLRPDKMLRSLGYNINLPLVIPQPDNSKCPGPDGGFKHNFIDEAYELPGACAGGCVGGC